MRNSRLFNIQTSKIYLQKTALAIFQINKSLIIRFTFKLILEIFKLIDSQRNKNKTF